MQSIKRKDFSLAAETTVCLGVEQEHFHIALDTAHKRAPSVLCFFPFFSVLKISPKFCICFTSKYFLFGAESSDKSASTTGLLTKLLLLNRKTKGEGARSRLPQLRYCVRQRTGPTLRLPHGVPLLRSHNHPPHLSPSVLPAVASSCLVKQKHSPATAPYSR